MAKYAWISHLTDSVIIGLFLIFLQETHCSVATNHSECRAISTIYGFTILIAGCVLYVGTDSTFHAGLNACAGVLLLPIVSNREGRHSFRESAPVYRSGHPEACGRIRQHEEADRFISLAEPFALIVARPLTLVYPTLCCQAVEPVALHGHVCSQTGETNTN